MQSYNDTLKLASTLKPEKPIFLVILDLSTFKPAHLKSLSHF